MVEQLSKQKPNFSELKRRINNMIIKMEKDIDESSLIEKIKKDPKISDTLSKKNIDKYFIVKNKLINLLIK